MTDEPQYKDITQVEGVRTEDNEMVFVCTSRETPGLFLRVETDGGFNCTVVHIGDFLRWLDAHPDITEQTMPCKECDGRGWVGEIVDHGDGRWSPGTAELCPKCRGKSFKPERKGQ